MGRRQARPTGDFLSGEVLRRCEKFVLRLLGPPAKGRGRWRLRYREEESGEPNDEGEGGYAFYATDWLRPNGGQWFGRMISCYRVEVQVWSPDPGHWWKAQLRISWKPGVFRFFGERAWMHVKYRPSDGRWMTEAEFEAALARQRADAERKTREIAAALRRKSKGMKVRKR